MAQSFVGEAWGSQELETLDLSEMCSLAQREEVEKFCDIVPPASQYPSHIVSITECSSACLGGRIGPWAGRSGRSTPDLVVVALLAEASSNRRALLLDDGALVRDGLGGSDVANKLLD